MTIEVIRERVASHTPVVVEGTGYAHAAVAIVLREADEGAEFVVIRIGQWSGGSSVDEG